MNDVVGFISTLHVCSYSNDAIYLLRGSLPVEAIWHLKIFFLYGAITMLEYTKPLHQVALWQMATTTHGDSWLVYIQNIAVIYGINVHQVLHNSWLKATWKT